MYTVLSAGCRVLHVYTKIILVILIFKYLFGDFVFLITFHSQVVRSIQSHHTILGKTVPVIIQYLLHISINAFTCYNLVSITQIHAFALRFILPGFYAVKTDSFDSIYLLHYFPSFHFQSFLTACDTFVFWKPHVPGHKHSSLLVSKNYYLSFLTAPLGFGLQCGQVFTNSQIKQFIL